MVRFVYACTQHSPGCCNIQLVLVNRFILLMMVASFLLMQVCMMISSMRMAVRADTFRGFRTVLCLPPFSHHVYTCKPLVLALRIPLRRCNVFGGTHRCQAVTTGGACVR